MAMLDIGGRRVQVDDSFLQLSPEAQQQTVEEISASLAAPARTPVAAPAPQDAPETYGEGYFAQGTSGINEGLGNLLGAPVDAVTTVLNAGSSGINSLFGTQIPQITDPFGGSNTFRGLMEGAGAIRPETDDQSKQFLRRTMQDVGATLPLLPMGGAAAQIALALGSGAGAATAEQVFPDNDVAELLGELIGAGGAAGAGRAARRAITPFPTSPERAAAADALAAEGVELTAGQRTGNKGLQYLESELGGGAAADMTERQAQQFTSAALSRAGVRAERATPEVMDRAFTNIGQEFDDLAARNVLQLDQDMIQGVNDVVGDYYNLVSPSARAPIIDNTITDLADTLAQSNGLLDGAAYQSLRSRLESAARSSTDPQLSNALRGLRGVLDDAMERSIGQFNPDDLGAWQQVRSDYRNMLVLEAAAGGAGEAAGAHLISPARLRQAAQSVLGKRSYVRGTNDFAELAQAGNAAMTPLPQSGTAPRTAVRNLGTGFLSLMGGGAGAAAGGPAGAVAGALAGAAVPAIAGRAVLSPLGRRYLGNQVLGPAGPTNYAPTLAAIASNQTSQIGNEPNDVLIRRALAAGATP